MSTSTNKLPISGPFCLDNEPEYARWRTEKLAHALLGQHSAPISIEADGTESINCIRERCRRQGYAVYETKHFNLVDSKMFIHALAEGLGLRRIEQSTSAPDGLAELQATQDSELVRYIPYSRKALNWHTDGYYNEPSQPVKAFILHCVAPAHLGGDNGLIDPNLVYIALRDEDPAFISALMHPEAMTVPANIKNGVTLRAEVRGPVFSIDPCHGVLLMRYTARHRSIQWRDDRRTRRATTRLRELLNIEASYCSRINLRSGQGLVANNVLHCRDEFQDDAGVPARFMLRARYYDRVIAKEANHAPS